MIHGDSFFLSGTFIAHLPVYWSCMTVPVQAALVLPWELRRVLEVVGITLEVLGRGAGPE